MMRSALARPLARPLAPAPRWAVAALALLAACAPPRTAPAPSTTPTPTSPTTALEPARPPVAREAARDWQLLDPQADGVAGTGVRRAERELLAGRTPQRTVIVAVIDAGIDTLHPDLRAHLWRNGREIAGNGRDDDGNGYADDVLGWSFIGGPGGDVEADTYEVTRLYVRCQRRDTLPAVERDRCGDISRDFERRRAEAEQMLAQVREIGQLLDRFLPVLRREAGTDSLTPERVRAIRSGSAEVMDAKQLYLGLAAQGVSPTDVLEARKQYASTVDYGLNPKFDPRPKVGDDYANVSERRYGNNHVMAGDPSHGTHVSGIVGAIRGNGLGIDGIATNVRIMAIRAVPDGDERDKDIANAIRYAADNGANVINMSFGKGYSPQKRVVDEAVKYADAKGVLMVHAAGNDGEDTGEHPSFPTPVYLDGGRAQNWIEVGASSWKGGDSLAAPFSNYNRELVDVFAPGVDILSTVPGGGYERESGTSMATPVVTGLAAMLMSYYPSLTASDVRRIILESATRWGDQRVVRPGSDRGERVPFALLSATGGVVNAVGAVRMAEEMTRARP
jgi:subtilisin family serine protease